jgi:hypothetical protein
LFTVSTASLLLEANRPHAPRTAWVVIDCWRWVSRMLEVASEADTDADTEERYAGAAEVSASGVPPMMLVQPTTPIATAAVPPATSAPTRACRRARPRGTVRHPVSTASDVTG